MILKTQLPHKIVNLPFSIAIVSEGWWSLAGSVRGEAVPDPHGQALLVVTVLKAVVTV